MFYTYVYQLPMVEGNLELTKGNRIVYTCGSIRRAKADDWGNRAFVLTDTVRDVTYRVTKEGMLVEYRDGPYFVRNPEVLKHTPFAVTGDEAEINSFLLLCNKMTEEHNHRKSFRARLRYFTREPVGKIIIAGAIIYAIVTVIVLGLG